MVCEYLNKFENLIVPWCVCKCISPIFWIIRVKFVVPRSLNWRPQKPAIMLWDWGFHDHDKLLHIEMVHLKFYKRPLFVIKTKDFISGDLVRFRCMYNVIYTESWRIGLILLKGKLSRFGIKHINTLRPRRNEQHFADDIFERIFFNENVWISIKISLKFVP